MKRTKISVPQFNSCEETLSYMEENKYEASIEEMNALVSNLLKTPKVVPFLIERVKSLAPLERRAKLDFPLRGLGEGYGASDGYMNYDYTDPRTLLLEAASRLTERGQCRLFGIPGAEAYFMEVAKTGKTLTALVQERLLEQKYGEVVLKMYVYQGGKLCYEVKKRYTVGDLLYGVDA